MEYRTDVFVNEDTTFLNKFFKQKLSNREDAIYSYHGKCQNLCFNYHKDYKAHLLFLLLHAFFNINA